MRATDASLAETREAAAAWLTGALDMHRSDAGCSAKPQAEDAGRDGRAAGRRAALARRAGEIRDELRFLLRAGDPAYVYFVEFRGKGIFLRAAPIDVSAIVRELLLDRMRTTVLTSATLTVDGELRLHPRSAGHPDRRRECSCRRSSTSRGRRSCICRRACPTRARRSSRWPPAGRSSSCCRRTRGRAFVLFTSYATLRAVQAIAEMALDYPILVQGTAPRSQLLKQFRDTPHSVLFATSSFWQGVDVVGEALSCVIVDKLPFASPGDPITAARIDAIRARGGEPFDEYQVPLAILTLQQGLGRLIRHRRDRGVLAVLDPRLRTKGYGRRFIASLPPAPVVHDLDGGRSVLSRSCKISTLAFS